MKSPETRRLTYIEFLRREHARVELEERQFTRGDLGRLGSRIYRTKTGRALRRELHKEELQRRAIRRREAQRRPV